MEQKKTGKIIRKFGTDKTCRTTNKVFTRK